MRRCSSFRVVVGLLLALVEPAFAFTARDMLGRTISLPAPPSRIVSLVPSATEIIFALDGDDRLVGVTDFCDWPPAARAKPHVGGMINPSLEAIVALRPDLVLVTDEGTPEDVGRHLQRVGIPTFALHGRRLVDVFEAIRLLGALTGRQSAAEPMIADMTAHMNRVRDAVRAYPVTTVLYVVWPEPLIVPGRDGIVTEFITLAGGRSVTADMPGAYPQMSLEAAVARDPQVIILADPAGEGSAAGHQALQQWRRLTSVPAIKRGRLYSLDLSTLHRYGPRIPLGLETLARVIHPEAFASR
jgi:iron complex transport system substrate-binding protein